VTRLHVFSTTIVELDEFIELKKFVNFKEFFELEEFIESAKLEDNKDTRNLSYENHSTRNYLTRTQARSQSYQLMNVMSI